MNFLVAILFALAPASICCNFSRLLKASDEYLPSTLDTFEFDRKADFAIHRKETETAIVSGTLKIDGTSIQVVRKTCPLHGNHAKVLFNEVRVLKHLCNAAPSALGIPKVYPSVIVDKNNSSLSFVMERLEGITLKDWLQIESNRENMTVQQLNRIILGARDLIRIIQSNNVFHGDISATNILVQRDGKTFSLVDFSTAAIVSNGEAYRREEGLYRTHTENITDRNFDFLCLKDAMKSLVENDLFLGMRHKFKSHFIFSNDDIFLQEMNKLTDKDCELLTHEGTQLNSQSSIPKSLGDVSGLHVFAVNEKTEKMIIKLKEKFPIKNYSRKSAIKDPTQTPNPRRILSTIDTNGSSGLLRKKIRFE